jgi:hypothetical protein
MDGTPILGTKESTVSFGKNASAKEDEPLLPKKATAHL